MINIKNNLKKTKGIIPAITLTCAELMEQHIAKNNMRFKSFDFSGVERILTHAAPHIDEYMALMIIRAALPDDKKLMPLEETYLSDAKNDTRAQSTWPTSILLGFGGTQDGGAHAGILFDEHESDEHQSASGITRWKAAAGGDVTQHPGEADSPVSQRQRQAGQTYRRNTSLQAGR